MSTGTPTKNSDREEKSDFKSGLSRDKIVYKVKRYNGDCHKILEFAYAKQFLSKRVLILKTVTTFVKRGLNLATRWPFTSIILYTNGIVGLKLLNIGTNVTKVLCVQRKN